MVEYMSTVVKEVMDRLLQIVFAHERSVLFCLKTEEEGKITC
jgi:hypothetical protein